MKRFSQFFDQIIAFDNLSLAAEKTLRGQKHKPVAARFYFNLEPELYRHIVREREAAYLAGEIDEETLARSVASMTGYILHADTLVARQQLFSESLRLG